MHRVAPRSRESVWAALALGAALLVHSVAFGAVALPADSGRKVIALLGDVGYATELRGGYWFDRIDIDVDSVSYSLRRRSDGEKGPAVGRLLLSPAPDADARSGWTPDPAIDPSPRSRSFILRVQNDSADPAVAAHLLAAQRSVVRHDRGDLYRVVQEPRRELSQGAEAPSDGAGSERVDAQRPASPGSAGRAWVQALTGTDQFAASLSTQLLFPALLLIALVLGAAVARWRRARPFAFSRRLVATHLLPVLIQCVVYLYWSLYWEGVVDHATILLLQLAFAFAFDLLWNLAMHHRWTAGFAPVPVVLSANLFVWFSASDQWLGFLVVALGLASKSLVGKDGRHVFNPSAAGLAVVGALCLCFPRSFDYDDIAHQLALPPNMIEVIVLAVLVAQRRVPIVLVSLGAAATLGGLQSITGWSLLNPYYPAVLIGILALATDPATIPRTGGGRLLYGLTLGAAIHGTGILLTIATGTDYWAKILPIPLANLLSPRFDRWASMLPARWQDGLNASRNPAHVVAWIVVVVWGLFWVDVKPGIFEVGLHRELRSPLVHLPEAVPVTPDRGAVCAQNRPFCEAFRFDLELRMWLER